MAILDARVPRARDGAAAIRGPFVIASASRPAHGGRIASAGSAVRYRCRGTCHLCKPLSILPGAQGGELAATGGRGGRQLPRARRLLAPRRDVPLNAGDSCRNRRSVGSTTPPSAP